MARIPFNDTFDARELEPNTKFVVWGSGEKYLAVENPFTAIIKIPEDLKEKNVLAVELKTGKLCFICSSLRVYRTR